MQLGINIFRYKIARRIFTLFVACALLPISGLSIISYRHVTGQLKDQSYRRLKQSAKGHGLSIYEKLLFLEAELQLIGSSLEKTAGHTNPEEATGSVLNSGNRFSSLTVFGSEVDLTSFLKGTDALRELETGDFEHIHSGGTVITYLPRKGHPPRVALVRLADSKKPGAGLLLGAIEPEFLWGVEQGTAIPPDTEVLVLNEKKTLLFSTLSFPNHFAGQAGTEIASGNSGQMELAYKGTDYLLSYQTVFMQPKFHVPGWAIVLSQSKASVLAPLSDFRTIFVSVLLMSLWVVLLLSIYSIRKSLIPLRLLKEGTRRIAMKDFSHRVEVPSQDEFQELAEDFNEMSIQLNRQFKTLDTKAEIDRAILSSLTTRTIVETVIGRLYDWFDCNTVAIITMDAEKPGTGLAYFKNRGDLLQKEIEFSSDDLAKLNGGLEYLLLESGRDCLSCLAGIAGDEVGRFLALPIFLKSRLTAVIVVGRIHSQAFTGEEIAQARQMASQVAVALSNANLIEELDRLNWGTLKALARAVDAKSHWTAGHSERVTEMALELGQALGFSRQRIDGLHRGALLHDIGKLGVPVAVLDKTGKLDNQEDHLIKRHPRIGANILEPIDAYREIVPIVLQHHERYDGLGYPDGLSGDAIDIGARVIAVADVYDALSSDRPYRKGMAQDQVVDFIAGGAGAQFDPDVVNAFLEIMRAERSMVV